MKKIILYLLLSCIIQKITAQQLTGLWYSSDSSRIYEIRSSGSEQWKVVIHSSVRKKDKVGYEVIPKLCFNKTKKRFEGYIYSTETDQPVFAKISFSNANTNEITLKLDRMFIFDATLKWTRSKNNPVTISSE